MKLTHRAVEMSNYQKKLIKIYRISRASLMLPLLVHFLQQDLIGFPKNLHWLSHWDHFKCKSLTLQFLMLLNLTLPQCPNLSSHYSKWYPKRRWGLRQDHNIPRHRKRRQQWESTFTGERDPISSSEPAPSCQFEASSMSLLILWFELNFLTLTYLLLFLWHILCY